MARMDTSFKLRPAALNPALPKAGTKSQLATSNIASPEATSVPAESLTLSAPLKLARPGSDMAQMVEDLSTPAPVVAEKPLREPRSDYMQAMVESVHADKALGSVRVSVNNNGAIALLEDFQLSANLDAAATVDLSAAQQEQAAEGGHEHGHGFTEDALLGGHIGTEVIEKLGHNAHHAVSHGATKVATHSAAEMADVANSTHEVAGHALSVGKEAAHHLSTGLEVALGVGAVGAGLLAVPITINGVKELKAGIKGKDTEKILEGVGNLAVGARSAGTAAVMTGMLTTSEVVTQVAGVAAQTLTPLGIVHAGIDTVLGVRDLKKGKVTAGLLKLGTGAAIGAAAVVGGLPLTVAALGMLGVKTGHKIYTHIQEKKQAAHEAGH